MPCKEECIVRIYDLSQTIGTTMPLYPGMQSPRIQALHRVEKDGYKEHLVEMLSHTGTHIDAPSHMELDGADLDDFPVAHFMGRAFVLDVSDTVGTEIPLSVITGMEDRIAGKAFLLLRTGWDRYWDSGGYFRGYPTPGKALMEKLVSFGLRGIGIDAISIDPVETVDFGNHHSALGSGMIIIENLTGLGPLVGREVMLSVLPLKWDGADGSPVRAVAWMKKGDDPHE